MARDPEWASRELAGLERNRSLYQSMGIPEAVQATETKIQALFRPFNREEYFLKVAAIGQGLRSSDERSFLAALNQARQLPSEYAPMILRGIAVDLRKEAEEIGHTRRRNELSMKALEAVASVEIEALHQEGRPQSAARLGNELREILDRIGQGLQSGQTLLEAVNAERSNHPASPFVEMYLERGLGSLVTSISQHGLNDWDFRNRLLDYAETLEHGQGLYSGARILAESLIDSTGEIHQRAQEILSRIPEEEEVDGRYRFILNLDLITADSNRSVLKLGATAMSFAAAGGLASAAESGAASWLTSSGASEASALLGSSLAHSLTMGAVQPLLAPGAEHLTWNSYVEQFVHMSGLTGVLGIRGALMRNVASPLAHYASTIGAMTAYDYITQPKIRNLPFALNLTNTVGNDLLMRSGEILSPNRASNGEASRDVVTGSWFETLPSWAKDLALSPLWLMMGVPSSGGDGKPPSSSEFKRGIEKTLDFIRQVTKDLNDPRIRPESFEATIRNLRNADIDWALSILTNVNFRNPGPKAFFHRLITETSPHELEASDLEVCSSFLGNPSLSRPEVVKARDRLIEFLQSNAFEDSVPFATPTVLRSIAHLFVSNDPHDVLPELVDAAVELFTSDPNRFWRSDGRLFFEIMFDDQQASEEGRDLIRNLLTGIIGNLTNPSIEGSAKVEIMTILESFARVDPLVTEQLPALRETFMKGAIQGLQNGKLGADFFIQAKFLFSQHYTSQADLTSLCHGLHLAYRENSENPFAGDSIQHLAAKYLLDSRLGQEAREQLVLLHLEELSNPSRLVASPINSIHPPAIRSRLGAIAQPELEKVALDLISDLAGKDNAISMHAALLLHPLLSFIQGSFPVRGRLTRLANQNKLPGMKGVYRRLMQALGTRPGAE